MGPLAWSLVERGLGAQRRTGPSQFEAVGQGCRFCVWFWSVGTLPTGAFWANVLPGIQSFGVLDGFSFWPTSAREEGCLNSRRVTLRARGRLLEIPRCSGICPVDHPYSSPDPDLRRERHQCEEPFDKRASFRRYPRQTKQVPTGGVSTTFLHVIPAVAKCFYF